MAAHGATAWASENCSSETVGACQFPLPAPQCPPSPESGTHSKCSIHVCLFKRCKEEELAVGRWESARKIQTGMRPRAVSSQVFSMTRLKFGFLMFTHTEICVHNLHSIIMIAKKWTQPKCP